MIRASAVTVGVVAELEKENLGAEAAELVKAMVEFLRGSEQTDQRVLLPRE